MYQATLLQSLNDHTLKNQEYIFIHYKNSAVL